MFLADIILIIHFVVIVFVLSIFIFVPYGYSEGWEWVRKKKIRYLHLFIISFVSIESVLGLICPLTILENSLRQKITTESFVSQYLSKIIYFNFPSIFFIFLYFFGLGLTLGLHIKYPPE